MSAAKNVITCSRENCKMYAIGTLKGNIFYIDFCEVHEPEALIIKKENPEVEYKIEYAKKKSSTEA